jgi:hypothetical protein
VNDAEVFLDQKRIGSTQEVLRGPGPLLRELRGLRELWEKTHPGEKFPGEINLQASKTTSSAVVSRVMGFLPSENYGSIQLVVMAGGAR